MFRIPIRYIPRIGARTFVYIHISEQKRNPVPVRISFDLYDTSHTNTSNYNEFPPLLVIHGFFGSKTNWRSVCRHLQLQTNPVRKIIALDMRNHGNSSHTKTHTYEACAEDIKALLEKNHISKVAIMGHSMGGRTAMYLALSNPQLIEKLIVVDISPVSNNKDLSKIGHLMTAMSQIKVPVNSTLSSARALADSALKDAVPKTDIRNLLLTNLIQSQDGDIGWRLNIPAIKRHFIDIMNFPIKPTSGIRYMGPTTFITGSISDYIPHTDHHKILRLFPKATFSWIPGSERWVHSEKRNEFIEIVVKILNRP